MLSRTRRRAYLRTTSTARTCTKVMATRPCGARNGIGITGVSGTSGTVTSAGGGGGPSCRATVSSAVVTSEHRPSRAVSSVVSSTMRSSVPRSTVSICRSHRHATALDSNIACAATTHMRLLKAHIRRCSRVEAQPPPRTGEAVCTTQQRLAPSAWPPTHSPARCCWTRTTACWR